MRAVAKIVNETTVESVIQSIKAGDLSRIRMILEVDLFTGEGVGENMQTLLHAAGSCGGPKPKLKPLKSCGGPTPNPLNSCPNVIAEPLA